MNRFSKALRAFTLEKTTRFLRTCNQFIRLPPVEVEKRNCTFLVNANLEYVLFWKNSRWEPETYAVLERFLRTNRSYIDMGAWIGPTLLFGAQLAGMSYAIEPDPVAFHELEINVELNPEIRRKTVLFEGAIAPRTGIVQVGNRCLEGNSATSLLVSGSKIGWPVQGLLFDDFVLQHGIEDCNFIKMDIEGGESMVLPTMKRYLEGARPTLFLSVHPRCFENAEEAQAEIFKLLGFYRYLYDSSGRRLEPEGVLTNRPGKKSYSIVATDEAWV